MLFEFNTIQFCFVFKSDVSLTMKENEKLSLVDLGKRLLEASRNGQADVVKQLMTNGAPFTTDWVSDEYIDLHRKKVTQHLFDLASHKV